MEVVLSIVNINVLVMDVVGIVGVGVVDPVHLARAEEVVREHVLLELLVLLVVLADVLLDLAHLSVHLDVILDVRHLPVVVTVLLLVLEILVLLDAEAPALVNV